MSDTLFPMEDIPEVPIFREPAARKSQGDSRFRNDYPEEWRCCLVCRGSGDVLFPDGPELCKTCKGMGSVKARVRLEAGFRCLRCRHPYIPKHDHAKLGLRIHRHPDMPLDEPSWREGGWSACDSLCDHGVPIRWRPAGQEAWQFIEQGTATAREFLDVPTEVEAAWRILTVHHADGDKANLAWWNLLALCQRCHLQIQGKVIMERVYPHEHSEWFKPFVAGYYAKVYLGEDLTREQVQQRLEELLALERAA